MSTISWNAEGPNLVVAGDNLPMLRGLPDQSFQLIYIDPPFNTGKVQSRQSLKTVRTDAPVTGSRVGFQGKTYETVRGEVTSYNDSFSDYWGFLEPRLEEALLSTGQAGAHKIQGIGANFVPDNYDSATVDEVMTVNSDDAIEMARKAATQEGLLVGISSGANLAAAAALAARPEFAGKTVVTLLPDTGERYLSTVLFAHLGD